MSNSSSGRRTHLPIERQWSEEYQRKLNSAIENQLLQLNQYAHVPHGGTLGQVLGKASDRHLDLEWVDNCCGDTGGGPGSAVRAPFIQASDPICGLRTTSYTPSAQTPLAEAGDYAVWIVYYQKTGAGLATDTPSILQHPGTWVPLAPAVYAHVDDNSKSQYSDINNHRVAVYGKFLTAADLTETHTVNTTQTIVQTICSRVLVYRNVHPDIPIGGMSLYTDFDNDFAGDKMQGTRLCLPIPVYASKQQVVQIEWALDNAFASGNPMEDATRIGVTGTLAHESHAFIDGGIPYADTAVSIYAWEADGASDENFIVGETELDSCNNANGWVSQACVYTRPDYNCSKLTAGGSGAQRHYQEYEVSLTAGESYTFAVLASARNSGIGPGFALTVVDPSSNERGFACQHENRNLSIVLDVDASTPDNGTMWRRGLWQMVNDGLPSQDGAWGFIHLTAPVTGTYKVRVGPHQYGATTLSWTQTSSDYIYVHHVLARSGKVAPYCNYTDTSSAVALGSSSYMRHTPAVSHIYSGSKPSQQAALKFNITPNWSALPAAALSPYMGGSSVPARMHASSAGYRYVNNVQLGGDDDVFFVPLERPVFPTKDGAPGKYYAEIKYTGTTTSSDNTSIGVRILNSAPLNHETYDNTNPGHTLPANESTFTTNDIFGVAVDYDAGTVKFYKNNTLVKTSNMVSGYPTTYSHPKEVPLCLFVRMRSDAAYGEDFNEFRVYAKSSGFTYSPPAGHIEWDFAGDEAITTDTFNESVEVTGADGVTNTKAFIGGEGIVIESATQSLTWRMAMEELAEIAAICDPSTDFALVYDASAAAHKRVRASRILTPLTSKGDLLVHNGTELVRVPAGTDGLVLKADSSAAAGVTWSTDLTGGGTPAMLSPDTVPTSPNTADDEFEGASFDTAKWTETNYNGTTTTVTIGGAARVYANANTGPHCFRQETSGSTFKYRLRLCMDCPSTPAFQNAAQAGIHFYHSGTTKWLSWHIGHLGGSTKHEVGKWTAGTFSTAVSYTTFFGDDSDMHLRDWSYLELEYDGTNIIWRASKNGLWFVQMGSESLATWFGAGNVPTHVGFNMHPSNTSHSLVAGFDWFRKF